VGKSSPRAKRNKRCWLPIPDAVQKPNNTIAHRMQPTWLLDLIRETKKDAVATVPIRYKNQTKTMPESMATLANTVGPAKAATRTDDPTGRTPNIVVSETIT